MKRNLFNLSHYKLLSMNMGSLVPVGLVEVLPGDTFQAATRALVRASPLLAPVMHPVHIRLSHWFVPHRLVWEDWEDFITGGPDGNDASVFPTIAFANGGLPGTLANYLGIPTTGFSLSVSALPFRGYAMIWNEWYRDQDLQSGLTIDKTAGVDTTTNTALQNCAWEKDYFTSARPWEQKGPAITVPLGTFAPVIGIGLDNNGATAGTGNTGVGVNATSDSTMEAGDPTFLNTGTSDNIVIAAQQAGAVGPSNRPQIFADLTGVSAVTVNILREAMALQRFEEARARYGSRYVEYLRYLGVRSSDSRLQRPEYLGGGQQTIQFSEVLQTAEGDDPVGELRGHGIGAVRSNRYRRFFEEHGYIFTMMSVKPKTIYFQGINRTWNRRVKEDFWQKELQHIGQQEILNKEVYASVAAGTGTGEQDGVFGYQDRYDEYRRQESKVAGEFQTTLNFWHFAREFGSPPTLNADFVKSVPSEEPFAVPSTDTIYVMARHSIKARRMVAKTGTSFIY